MRGIPSYVHPLSEEDRMLFSNLRTVLDTLSQRGRDHFSLYRRMKVFAFPWRNSPVCKMLSPQRHLPYIVSWPVNNFFSGRDFLFLPRFMTHNFHCGSGMGVSDGRAGWSKEISLDRPTSTAAKVIKNIAETEQELQLPGFSRVSVVLKTTVASCFCVLAPMFGCGGG